MVTDARIAVASGAVGEGPRPESHANGSPLDEQIKQIADAWCIDEVSLRARIRIAFARPSSHIIDTLEALKTEADTLRSDRNSVSHILLPSDAASSVRLADAKLVLLSEDVGTQISTTVHYLGSPRSNGMHFGLVDGLSGRIVGYAAINRLDWPLVVNAMLDSGLDTIQHLSLSRLYVAPGAPPNTISRMLSLLVHRFASEKFKAVISTVVDQNLGFRGSSYLASGWRELFSVAHLGYLYVDGRFRTRRDLIKTFGTDNAKELTALLGARIEMSGPMPSDILIFATSTERRLRLKLGQLQQRQLIRPHVQDDL